MVLFSSLHGTQRRVSITTTVVVLDLALLQPDTLQSCPARKPQDPQQTPADTDKLPIEIQPLTHSSKKQQDLVHGRWGMLAVLHVLWDIMLYFSVAQPSLNSLPIDASVVAPEKSRPMPLAAMSASVMACQLAA